MKRAALAVVVLFALSFTSTALTIGIGARAYGDLAGALSGNFADSTARRYADLGASSFSSLGSSAALPAITYGGGLELCLNGLFTPRFGLAVGLGYGLWGWGLEGKDSAGQGFASSLLFAPVADFSLEARFALPLGAGAIEPALGAFVGLIYPRYKIEERISGVYSSIDPAPLLADALVAGFRASVSYVLRAGPGRLRLGAGGAFGSSLASATGSLGGSLLLPWRAGLDLGYVLLLGGGKK